MLGLGHGLALALAPAKAGGDGVVCDVYVDAVGGSDSHPGRSAALAKRTLAGALGIAGAGEVIGLKRGSLWREGLDLTSLTAPQVVSYGSSGAPPRISGADIVTGWSLVAGRTHVHAATISHDADGSNRLRVYEDDAPLVRVLDEAACDATAGSFVILVGSDGSPVSVKMHPSDSGDPNVNGKVYEVTVRTTVIAGPDGCTMRGIQTERAISNNGSADLVSRLDGVMERMIGADGSKHNLGIGSGVMRDCIAFRADTVTAVEPSNTQLVAFVNDGAGRTAEIVRCGVIGPAPGADFIAHGNPTSFDSVTAEQLWVYHTFAFTSSFTLNRGPCYIGVLRPPMAIGTLEMAMTEVMQAHTAAGAGEYGALTVQDCVLLKRQSVTYDEMYRTQGNPVVMTQCAHFCDTSLATGYPSIWWNNMSSAAHVTLTKSVFFNGTLLMKLTAGATYIGDFNVWLAGEPGETRPVTFLHPVAGYCLTLAAWQAATGQDANSVYLARADQSRGNAHAFWLGVADDANDGPLDGDWRINPNARVYDGGDVAHIGTFADGTTPITQAGPQQHWDWNLRAAADGAPTRWPAVPDSLAAARTYVLNPEGWNFYP